MNAKDVSEALGDVKEEFIAEAITYQRKKLPFWFPIAAVAACLCLLIGMLPQGTGSLGYAPTMGGVPTGPVDGYGYSFFRDGVPVKGLVIGGDYNAVTVQSLQVTLELNGSPVGVEPAVNTTVMEYAFHNPSDTPITLTLTLPCGQDPWYETGTNWFGVNRHLYTASVNGEPLDLTLRITADDTPPGEEDNWSIGIFSDDTPVTVFTYEITALESRDTGHVAVSHSGLGPSVVILENDVRSEVITASTTQYLPVSLNQQITLYVFGDPTGFRPIWQFFSDYTREESISGTAALVSTQHMTFREYAVRSWDVTSGSLLSDWAFSLATQIHRCNAYSYSHVNVTSPILHRWFRYELTLEPGETVINTVTAPLYPDVLFGSNRQQYQCHFDILSMRKPTVQNGPVITVNAPFPLLKSNLEWSETDTGYSLDLTDVHEIKEILRLGIPAAEVPQETAPATEPPTQIHWLTILGGAVLLVLGLYWFVNKKT